MNSKRHLLTSSCAGSYGFDIGGKYDSGFSHHPGHLYSLTHTHTHCMLLLIQSLSLPSALLEEFDLTWESMNSSTQQNAALPQSTGSRQESVLLCWCLIRYAFGWTLVSGGYYLRDWRTLMEVIRQSLHSTFIHKCTTADVLSIPTYSNDIFKSGQDICGQYDAV